MRPPRRTFDDMRPEFLALGAVLDKYARVSKLPKDFGVGMPVYPAEIHALAAICRQGAMGVTELARLAGVTKGAASQLVSRLEGKGLVRKAPDPDNDSRIVLRPTPLGEQAQAAHLRFHQEHDREFLDRLGSLGPEEYRTFARICRWMVQWMDNYA